MLSLGFGEIFVAMVVLLLAVGPERLPHLLRSAGRTYGKFRNMADEMRRAFVLEADRIDEAERFEEDKQRRASFLKAQELAQQVASEGGAVQERVLPKLTSHVESRPEVEE